MCFVSAPKVATPTATPDPPVLRNPYLDGIDPILRARQTGMSSLRVDRGSTGYTAPAAGPLTISRAPGSPQTDARGNTYITDGQGRKIITNLGPSYGALGALDNAMMGKMGGGLRIG